MPLLEINDVSVSFGDTEVLSGISLELESKQLLAVLGASGAGKSTLMRLIAGFDSVGGGSIVLDGEILSDSLRTVAPERRSIGIVPQDSALFPHLNVSQNIGFGLSGLSKEAKAERVGELLRLIRMEEFASRMPQELSGGQVQRVALARALAPRPKLVLLDEPFSALDAELRGQLREEVRQVLRAEGATAVLVTHDQEEALSLADRVAVLREGKIIQVGSPSEIYNSPADVGIATFLGESVLVDGKVSGGKILTDLGSLSALNNVAEGATGVVAIRSENFYLQPNPTGDSEVVGRVFFGHDALVEVQTPKLRIRARSNGPFAPEVGMRVTVWVRGAVNFYPSS
ncbi:MAG: ABC transporter ATP-binding protein [Actinobacteria bacterium]|nr:ABC transporter ATP-binding protein [Actinomycetota bacterium]NCV80553.1 ABC transporter ATP-binding protein [Actinomycetota bacterium]NCV98628.1 ABC transporter ATP-binding protein [Actinomycetota bacterium]NCW41348.1 ABC transporter ATP-binding protein [Actinomycetota bacterium]NCW95061.1 ABC transporter ATP-binding protein [Actinomycetota bacterium]